MFRFGKFSSTSKFYTNCYKRKLCELLLLFDQTGLNKCEIYCSLDAYVICSFEQNFENIACFDFLFNGQCHIQSYQNLSRLVIVMIQEPAFCFDHELDQQGFLEVMTLNSLNSLVNCKSFNVKLFHA